MEFRFLGGAEEIGRLGLVATHGGRSVLLDYGMAPETPPEYPDAAPDVDGVLLTHAHLDHSGMLPGLTAAQQTDIWSTDVSRRISGILHQDSIKIADMEGYPRPFSPSDADHCGTRFRVTFPGDPLEIGPFDVTPMRAGHIPGALQWRLSAGDRTMAFTGDLYPRATRLVPAAEQAKADILFIESTYAGRRHPDRRAEELRLATRVKETVERGGTCIVPAFATGRAQEVLMALAAHTDYEVFVDGMGGRVLDIFLSAPETLADPRALKTVRARCRFVRNHRQRRHAAEVGEVIVATSGMLDGGPVLFYIDRLRDDRNSSILLTGYQVPGTNGRRLLDERVISDRGADIPVHMEVDKFDLSTHLDHPEIVEYVRRSGCEDVVLYHGFQRELLVEDLTPHARVHLPVRGETFRL